MRAALLEARDARQGELQRALGQTPAASILMLSTNIPGEDKHRPGLTRLLRGALQRLQEAAEVKVLRSGRDLLGPFQLLSSSLSPAAAKGLAISIEAASPAARILDLDVYRPDGAQIDRASLGLPPRPCFVCAEAARECIRLQRHSAAELRNCVDGLLQSLVPGAEGLHPKPLAEKLLRGALQELELTPKPGLVDRLDQGSHPDLSYAAMRRSAELLPIYFEDLLQRFERKRPLEDCVQAGVAAESRMFQEIHANAHKGFIFLSGLLLLAACEGDGRVPSLRENISRIARHFFAHFESPQSRNAGLRDRHALGGIRAEAEQGLPAVFEHGWPKYREALEAGWEPTHAAFYLMAILMQKVEDTTAIHRCGLEGLSRLRKDGAKLQRLLEQQGAPEATLSALNEEYCRSGLTMGGVADCMALTFALQGAARFPSA